MSRVRQNLSSDSLFHFLRRREWLVNILKNKAFQARYVYEDIPELKYNVGIPMKCFCDIPLGMIKRHMSQYGKFGIGIKKKYARQNNFAPVIYVHDNSDTLIRYIKSMTKSSIFNNSQSLLPYIKWDERATSSINGAKKFFRYYDEREWRYIPKDAKFIDFKGFDEEEIRKTALEYNNNEVDSNPNLYSLPFEYFDISYIFVQFDEDVDKVIDEIHSLKIPDLDQDRLMAKIITSQQIEKDF